MFSKNMGCPVSGTAPCKMRHGQYWHYHKCYGPHCQNKNKKELILSNFPCKIIMVVFLSTSWENISWKKNLCGRVLDQTNVRFLTLLWNYINKLISWSLLLSIPDRPVEGSVCSHWHSRGTLSSCISLVRLASLEAMVTCLKLSP